jgi:polar amino acid transport system substrate-binding protein
VRRLLLVAALALATACDGQSAPSTPPAELSDESESRTLVLATSEWAPYTGGADTPRIAQTLVRDALISSGYDAKFETYEVFAEAEARLVAGAVDGSPALWKSAEREERLLFSEPYLVNRLVVVGRAGADVKASSLTDLAGKRVAVVEGYAYGEAVDSATDVNWDRRPDQEACFRALLASEVDYVLIDELVIRHLAERQPADVAKHLAIGEAALVTRSLHFAVSRNRADAVSLIETFNAKIRNLLAQGKFHAILGIRWIRADVDGDGVEELALAPGAAAGEAPPTWSYDLEAERGPLATESTVQPAKQDRVGFFVDGQRYERWEDIPPERRVRSVHPENAPGTATIFEFRF